MMFLVTAFQAVAAGGGITSAIAAGLSTVTVGSVLTGATALFGALSAHGAAETQARNAEFQGQQLLVEGKVAAANAKKEENQLRERLLENLASTNAAAAASGIQLTSGTVESGREAAFRQANRELSTTRTDADIQQAGRRAKIAKLRIDASAARRGGKLDAAAGLTGSAVRELRRG